VTVSGGESLGAGHQLGYAGPYHKRRRHRHHPGRHGSPRMWPSPLGALAPTSQTSSPAPCRWSMPPPTPCKPPWAWVASRSRWPSPTFRSTRGNAGGRWDTRQERAQFITRIPATRPLAHTGQGPFPFPPPMPDRADTPGRTAI